MRVMLFLEHIYGVDIYQEGIFLYSISDDIKTIIYSFTSLHLHHTVILVFRRAHCNSIRRKQE